jgi:hypothetical protein
MESADPRLIRVCSLVLIVVVVLLTIPRQLVGRDAHALFTDDRTTLIARADRVAHHVTSGVQESDFTTGSPRFDGEWAFGTYQMAVLGLAQVIQSVPDEAERFRPALRLALDQLLAPKTRAFAREAWGTDAFESLSDLSSRDAWLGYVALSMSVARDADPKFRYIELHDEMITSLRTRIEASPSMLIETYPGETYPVDVSAAIAAIDLHARLTDGNSSPLVDRWVDKIRSKLLDANTGYLSQTGPEPGMHRGSGTSLAAYFLGFAPTPSAQELTKDLYKSLRVHGFRFIGGFGVVREYASDFSDGGDIDSGPVFQGFGVSVTGFALASAKRFGDEEMFTALHRTAALTGVPYNGKHGKGFVVGGPLGDAILLAMETAQPMGGTS